ncbi:Uncharacterised protein [Amycolatopsis camponoti]|uniref:DUF2306 domain-containing protein n=1 Tax=Amycolatopsis camponoti TaxID=2606593 RepID=A0A6I8LYB2_9PSEU|nr:DUF2306 domain-containing protein [Amycolatopsis camponoti]VVJ20416.1 Uncharacterised protein [Amycolatopsis camponoti]
MTQHIDEIRVPGPRRPGRPPSAPATAVKFWQRPWIIPLWLVVAAFLYVQTSPFVGTPESQAPTPPHDGFAAYYPLLIAHISFGTVVMLSACLQMWPMIRHRYPKVHRAFGRVYAIAAIPTGVAGLIIVPFAPPVGQIGVTLTTALFLASTIAAWVLAVKRKFKLHRRFMIYSFALLMNNVWGPVIVKIGLPLGVDITYLLESARWVGWVVNLMIAQWFLYWTASRRREFA